MMYHPIMKQARCEKCGKMVYRDYLGIYYEKRPPSPLERKIKEILGDRVKQFQHYEMHRCKKGG